MKSKPSRNKLVADLMSATNYALGQMVITKRLFSVGESHCLSVAARQLESALSELEMFDAEEADKVLELKPRKK